MKRFKVVYRSCRSQICCSKKVFKMPQYGKNALEREEEESMEQKEWGNESISFNFHLQVLVLVKTEMQILNYANVRTADSFSLTFSLNFLCFGSCVFIFCVCISDKLKNIWNNWKISEAGIGSCFVKQPFGKM